MIAVRILLLPMVVVAFGAFSVGNIVGQRKASADWKRICVQLNRKFEGGVDEPGIHPESPQVNDDNRLVPVTGDGPGVLPSVGVSSEQVRSLRRPL